MIIRSCQDIKNTPRDVSDKNWRSLRLLLANENMGFSLHITTIEGGSEIELHYRYHLEAVYCVKGKGSIIDLAKEETHTIEPGVMYALNNNDKHRLIAEHTLELVCVFNPPCTGQEVHDETGAYPLKESNL